MAFVISIIALKRTIKIKLGFRRFLVKPIVATVIMAVCSYFIYSSILGIIAEKLATIIAIVSAIIIYALAIVALKIFTKQEIKMLPAGNKICMVLEKLKIY